jgi:hypothetical protein
MDDQSFKRRMPGLSEDEVKRRFVPFLREFYRKRFEPMPGSEAVELDNVGEGGLVADGKMTFRKADGSPFVCTYEATSRDKAQEVKFSINEQYLLWDAAAFGAIIAAILYAAFYVTRRDWLIDLRLEGNLGLLIGMTLIAFLLWFFLLRSWRKYRYIYAIEQFKQYQADEQWVAIAEDVFPSPTDPYLIELRNQCVFSGFGLAIVTAENGVRALSNPSRLGIYGEDRRITHWVTRADWYQAITQSPGGIVRFRPPDTLTVAWNKLSRPVRYLLLEPARKYALAAFRRPLGQTATVYNRFMSGQRVQKWVCALAFLLLVSLAWRVVNTRTDQLADLEKRTAWQEGENPEDQPGYRPSDEVIPYGGEPTGVPKQFAETKQEAVSTINLSGDDETPTINLSGDDATPANGIEKEAATAPPSLPDLCAVLAGQHGWLVQDNLFITRANATDRVAALRKKGLSAQVVSNTCIEAGEGGYVVWVGKVQASRDAALRQIANYEKALQRYGLLQGKLSVRRLL